MCPFAAIGLRGKTHLTMLNVMVFRQVVNFVQSNPRLLEAFLECNKTIDEIQKGLEEYLEKKRQSFARFYFLSNDQVCQLPLISVPFLRAPFLIVTHSLPPPDSLWMLDDFCLPAFGYLVAHP